MKVKDLIEALEKHDPEMEIVIASLSDAPWESPVKYLHTVGHESGQVYNPDSGLVGLKELVEPYASAD